MSYWKTTIMWFFVLCIFFPLAPAAGAPNITGQILSYNNRLGRRDTASITTIVIHCTETPTLAEAREFAEKILYPGSRTGNSGHYYIDRDGGVFRYVTDDRIAHHTRSYNPVSIGIELVNRGRFPNWHHSGHQTATQPYPAVQMNALMKLLKQLKQKYPGITILARHSDLDRAKVPATDDPKLRVNRKMDPGPMFPWKEVLKKWQKIR